MLINTPMKNLPLNPVVLFVLHACDPSPFFAIFHAFSSLEISPQADYPQHSLNVGLPCLKIVDFVSTFS